MTRREWLAALGGAVPVMAGAVEVRQPSGWFADEFKGKTVYTRGSGPAVVLLHEINGLSPGCVDFGAELACHGFRVLMPRLFGRPVQDNIVFGTLEAMGSGFSFWNKNKDSAVVQWLRDFVGSVEQQTLPGKGIGVIGMCLTGAMPLAVMGKTSKVRAVVLSQPALPFGKGNDASVGLSPRTLQSAKESGTPIIGFRFCGDTLCTHDRFRYLHDTFGDQFTPHELPDPAGFRPDCTHRLHAVLTGAFGDAKASARKIVVDLLTKNLI